MPKEKTLAPVRPNQGLEAAYRQKLQRLIDEMFASVFYWLKAGYKRNTPEIAQDASPAKELQRIIKNLANRWQDRFDEEAKGTAEWFADSVRDRSDRAILHSLRKEGMSVKFKMTRAMNDVLQATTAENVALIKSIPSQFFTQIEGAVMRSVASGRDLGTLTKELQNQYGVTHRRAALISRDQNSKANANLSQARQLALGITDAYWMHSKGGRHPRPSHVSANGRRFKIAEGCLIDGEYILPGQLINCHPGNSMIEFSNGCKKLWRHRYSGQLTQIVTHSGKTIKSTPNHPILTQRGWLPAHAINSGDYVVHIGNQIIDSIETDVQSPESTIEQVFNAAASLVGMDTTIMFGSEFHGDITDPEVQTVDMDSLLGDEIDPASAKFILEFLLSESNMPFINANLSIDGLLEHGFDRLFCAPRSIIRGLGSVLSLFLGHFGGTDNIGLGLISSLKSSLSDQPIDYISACIKFIRECEGTLSGKISRNDHIARKMIGLGVRASAWYAKSVPNDCLLEGAFINAEFSSGSSHAGNFNGSLDRVVKNVSIDSGATHVYNLETNVGWYSVNGIVSHNCRCVKRVILPALDTGD